MKFSGKMCLMIILKVTKNQGFTLFLEDTFFEKPQGGGGQIDPPAVLGLKFVIAFKFLDIDFLQFSRSHCCENQPVLGLGV